MSLPLKNGIVAKSELKQTVSSFVKALKTENPGCMVVTLTRELASNQSEVISMAVSETMPSELVEQMNQRVEELMKQGFQMSQNFSDVQIQHSIKGANFDPTAGGLKFGSD